MRATKESNEKNVRIAMVQWDSRVFLSYEKFVEKCEAQLNSISNYGADFALYPEYFSLSLMGLMGKETEKEQLQELTALEATIKKDFAAMAQSSRVNIIAGSIPTRGTTGICNTCFFFGRDGQTERYDKIHLTPFEQYSWKMEQGNKLGVLETDCGKIGIQICYDIEFPELSRIYADQGVQLILVPYSTDSEEGFYRVRHCAQSRAIENECYVAIAPCVGYLPEVSAVEYQHGQAALFTPADMMFPPNGLKKEGIMNTEGLVITDINFDLLDRLHEKGSVQNLKDRRLDFYKQFQG